MRVKLTDRFVKFATTDGRKSPIFMDDEVIGFGVQSPRDRPQKASRSTTCSKGGVGGSTSAISLTGRQNAAREHAKAAHRIRLYKKIRRPQTML